MQPLRDPRPSPDLKICGITDLEQALAIARMGVQAIGVIGVQGTPRYVEPSQRRALFTMLEEQHPLLHRVWVVADPDDAALEEALSGAGQPSVVQLHGGESSDRCRILKQRYPQQQWWKALRVREPTDLPKLKQYDTHVDALLLDAWSSDQLGGTGHRIPLDWLGQTELSVPWWLAGGVSSEWVPELLSRVNPQGLDASSRLEERPGWKNLDKVQALVEAVHQG
ncbi:phosphoribosylanthranilate isomerase [Synechococcus sp. MU1611]|uniref:phosphoribosylanthranilate isomerase n=1 Tax=Synechococcus sp. MU1611 TaxID=2508345 RepID=UPI001CF8526C|nr:phosphoribosylanthranilate isomerase [Synechococcus sp. MU1611]MCB4411725.1 phosphoribosylanthranilate isomerase [Synechococcus sp. MU1611]